MRILIVNPNTTASMTRTIEAAAQNAASARTQIVALNPETGPQSIQGRDDGEAALPGLYELFEREVMNTGGYDAVIIACFDDTGLVELRSRSPIPVIGIGEAAYHRAADTAAPFSVVTTLSVSVPILTENIAASDLAAKCAGVRASGVPVLDIEAKSSQALASIAAEIASAIRSDGCRSIVLGCAGMADLARTLEENFSLPVIEGVGAAVSYCESYAATGQPEFMQVRR